MPERGDHTRGNLPARQAWLLPAAIFLANFAWKLAHINDRPVSLDEPFSIFFAQLPPGEVITELTKGNNPPLFELLLHYWIQLFGISPASVRFISVVASSLTATVLFITGRKFFSPLAGLTAALLFSLSNYHLHYAFEARVYALFSLFATLSIYYFLSLTRNPGSRKYLFLLALFNLLLIYGHYFGLFIPLTEVLISFFFLKRKPFARSFYLSAGITLLLYTPMISVLLTRFLVTMNEGTWMAPPSAGIQYLYMIYDFFNGREQFYPVIYLIAAGLLLHLFFERENLEKTVADRLMWALWLLFLLPFTIMFVGSSKIPMFMDRYVLYTSVPLYLATGSILHLLYQRFTLVRLEWIPALIIGWNAFSSLNTDPELLYARRVDQAVSETQKLMQEHPDASVIIYPFWMDKAFGYHYDKKLFTDYRHFHQALAQRHIYPVWSDYEADSVLRLNPTGKVIYFRDELNINDTLLDPLYMHFDTLYGIGRARFYPLTSNVFYFEK